MGTNVSNFQNNAKNSNIILTSESNEMEFSKEVKTVSSFKNSDFGELKIIIIDEEPYFIGSPNRALYILFISLWRSGLFPVLHFFLRDDSRKLYHRVKIVFKII